MNFSDYPHVVNSLLIVAAALFTMFKLDDLSFDLAFWMKLIQRKAEYTGRAYQKLTDEKLLDQPQKRIAIFVPCWHESDVVQQMLEFATSRIRYENYSIFVGVYPNDAETIAKVEAVRHRFPRVHMVVNEKPGPTTKAQNLNCMFRRMVESEGEEKHEVVVLHDVEDVIHPLSLHIYNYLIPQHAMIQLPVIPLEPKWNDWVGWTYCDEFSQNHMKDMILRESIGAFVPSAGVGCAFNRKILERLKESSLQLFPEDSLTEDYRTGLRLHSEGFSTIFVLQRLSRGEPGFSGTASDYVATRAYFPNTFATAVRQKARWVSGIGLQTWKAVGWAGGFLTRYVLYRDRKITLSNLIPVFGYAVFTLAAISYALHVWHPQQFPSLPSELDPISEALLAFVFAVTALQVVQSAVLIGWVYGPLQGVLYLVRVPIGASINAMATIRAWSAFIKSHVRGTPMTWAKTAHIFPTKSVIEEATSAGVPKSIAS